MLYTATATINLAALRHNLLQVRKLAPDSQIMAAVKADAYGHGIVEAANALSNADGLAVARLEEALQLRKAGIKQPILLLGGAIQRDGLQTCSEHAIDLVIHSNTGVETLLEITLEQPINCWLKHDSGMHRLGLNNEALGHAHHALSASTNVNSIVLMTHFSSAEASNPHITQAQLASFQAAAHPLSSPQSLANSAAIIKFPDTHAHWVRPGIMLYGANPLSPELAEEYPVDLQPVMTLSAKILAIRAIKSGESVGYNGRWTAQRDSVIATLGIGYGDGYPRHAQNGTPVLVNGQRASLVGTVSMDLTTIDISHCKDVSIGDDVMLWGDGLAVEEVASCAGTISYELLTSVSKRVPRFYLDN